MPIRNLIVLAPSGLVLFEKEYGKEKIAQPRLLGSLLTAMTEFATQTTAMRPSYIEMSSLAVTMCREDSVTCALVHDRTDKALFGLVKLHPTGFSKHVHCQFYSVVTEKSIVWPQQI